MGQWRNLSWHPGHYRWRLSDGLYPFPGSVDDDLEPNGAGLRLALYDVAFALVVDTADAGGRRAISQVTLLGGFSSALFGPVGARLFALHRNPITGIALPTWFFTGVAGSITPAAAIMLVLSYGVINGLMMVMKAGLPLIVFEPEHDA